MYYVFIGNFVPLILIQGFQEAEYKEAYTIELTLPNITKHLGTMYANLQEKNKGGSK